MLCRRRPSLTLARVHVLPLLVGQVCEKCFEMRSAVKRHGAALICIKAEGRSRVLLLAAVKAHRMCAETHWIKRQLPPQFAGDDMVPRLLVMRGSRSCRRTRTGSVLHRFCSSG